MKATKTLVILMGIPLATSVCALEKTAPLSVSQIVEQLRTGLREKETVPLFDETEYGGGGPLCGPLYVTPMPPFPKTIYVPAGSPDTLQRFVDLAAPGDEIVVPPGLYDMGGRQRNQEGPATRLVIDKPLTLRSAEGPENTIIAGGPSTRCIYMTNGVQVIGFTITGGETMAEGPEGNKITALSGGGVWSEPDGMLIHCIVVSNTALWYGGGLYGGSALRCIFSENTAERSGGGASTARLGSCLLQYNRAGRSGGGAHRCELHSCTVAHNRAEVLGGGAAYGTAQNTVLQHNQTRLTGHNYSGTEMTYCSSMPKATGPGNIGGEPGFRNSDAGVFSLEFSSPLVDAGTNVSPVGADLTGRPRILDGNNNRHARIDIGAYEYVHPHADSNRDGIADLETMASPEEAVRFERPAK